MGEVSALSASRFALDPEFTRLAERTPTNFASLRSNSLANRPVVNHPSSAESTTEQMSSAPITLPDTGTTDSPDYPNQIGWSTGGDFLTGLNPSGSGLIFSSRLPNDTAAASVAVDPAGAVHVAGFGGLVSTITTAQGGCGCTRIFGIANAAYGPADGRISPGEVISIYGPRLGPATPVTAVPSAAGLVPTSLAGVQVTVNGSPIPLLYVSDTQVNAVTPLYLSGSTARLSLTFNGAPAADFVAAVLPTIPEIFQNADGTAAAVNPDGSINSADHPAPPGSIVSIWTTGIGATPYGGWQDGHLAAVAADFACCQVFAPTPANVFYAGAAPGIVAGVAQVNFQLQLPASPFFYYGPTVSISLIAGGAKSHPAQIYIAVPAVTDPSPGLSNMVGVP